jgi:2-polyprenyl-3-methyl-5-hydroxy-6-metoxy-1,4-benzoquinol methylase
MAYFDRIWSALPSEVEPERFGPRRRFLLEQVRAGERVLDVGCGEGSFSAALAAAGAHPVGVDVASEAIRRASGRHPELELHQVGETLPFEDASFDVAWAGEVLEHVQDVVGLLDEVRRVLRPGGRLLVSTPDHPRRLRLRLALEPGAFEAHFDPRSDHVRFFTRQSLGELLAACQFGDLEINSRNGDLLATAARP